MEIVDVALVGSALDVSYQVDPALPSSDPLAFAWIATAVDESGRAYEDAGGASGVDGGRTRGVVSVFEPPSSGRLTVSLALAADEDSPAWVLTVEVVSDSL
jgi:hypothetical protein